MRLERDVFGPREATVSMCPIDELVTRVHDDLKRNGGFTVDGRTGHPIQRGLAVCADPDVTLAFPVEEWNAAVVAGWWDRHRQGSARRHRVHVGGWWDPHTGRVALDVVHVLPYAAHAFARAMGRRHRQQAMFDLGAHRLVCLGDEGLAPA